MIDIYERISVKFDSTYYRSGNYEGYLDRLENYRQLAASILGFIQPPVLDYGCAVGFLVKSLKSLGCTVSGYDISEWAVNYGQSTLGIQDLHANWKSVDRNPGTLICLDVLEHMTLGQVNRLFEDVPCQRLIVRIPVSDGVNFILPESRMDATHITCYTKTQWEDIFFMHGFHCIHTLKEERIWDSLGVLSRVYAQKHL